MYLKYSWKLSLVIECIGDSVYSKKVYLWLLDNFYKQICLQFLFFINFFILEKFGVYWKVAKIVQSFPIALSLVSSNVIILHSCGT